MSLSSTWQALVEDHERMGTLPRDYVARVITRRGLTAPQVQEILAGLREHKLIDFEVNDAFVLSISASAYQPSDDFPGWKVSAASDDGSLYFTVTIGSMDYILAIITPVGTTGEFRALIGGGLSQATGKEKAVAIAEGWLRANLPTVRLPQDE